MSRSKPNSSDFLKKLLLEKSETFCMMPWVHLHTTPTGVASPCCIAESCATDNGVGNSRMQSLEQLVNSDQMKQLRLDMLTGKKNVECRKCYEHESQGVKSFRQFSSTEWQHAFDDVIKNTDLETGEVSNFKMRYFDIRFSNICNFKCRTCGPAFSTQWEQEDLKSGVHYATILPKNNNPKFLQDVIDQIDNMEIAYFAGGEPLITEEHYILLEEMIKRKRTDIKLRYNTNLSNFKYKNKDILKLWSKFENNIEIYASIDHVEERAEYIRHGTVWKTVEENFLKAKKTKFIEIQVNTVLSAFNYLTIYEFYKYLIDHKMYTPTDNIYTLYNMSTPDYLTCHILPPELKEQGRVSVEKAVDYMKKHKFRDEQIAQLEITTQWVNSKNTWEEHGRNFKEEITRLDAIRNENFLQTFPELKQLYTVDRKKMWPV